MKFKFNKVSFCLETMDLPKGGKGQNHGEQLLLLLFHGQLNAHLLIINDNYKQKWRHKKEKHHALKASGWPMDKNSDSKSLSSKPRIDKIDGDFNNLSCMVVLV